jgi:type IV secretory pathway VirB3-like protein
VQAAAVIMGLKTLITIIARANFRFAGASAALAAVGMVLQSRDPTFSQAAINKAQQVYRFATSQDVNPQSYCAFVPCTTNITVTNQVSHNMVPNIFLIMILYFESQLSSHLTTQFLSK